MTVHMKNQILNPLSVSTLFLIWIPVIYALNVLSTNGDARLAPVLIFGGTLMWWRAITRHGLTR